MTAIGKTLDQVSGLLEELPGVNVLSSTLIDGSAYLEIMASNAAALDTLRQMSLGANVALEILSTPFDADGAEVAPTRLAVTASTTERDLIEFGELQLLGIHLAWHLHMIGLITTPYADRLLHNWHGATVGA